MSVIELGNDLGLLSLIELLDAEELKEEQLRVIISNEQ
jgi:hypothetical protein